METYLRISRYLRIMACCFAFTISIPALATGGGNFKFESITPFGRHIETPFVGRSGSDLLVIGGYHGKGIEKIFNGIAYHYDVSTAKWIVLGGEKLLPHYGGAAVSSDKGLICVGGYAQDALTQQVTRYTLVDGKLASVKLPDLPLPLVGVKADIVAGHLYAVGSEGAFSLDLLSDDAQWKTLPASVLAGSSIDHAIGVAGKLFLFVRNFGGEIATGNTILRYGTQMGFEVIDTFDHDLTSLHVASCGQGYVLFMPSNDDTKEILGYYSVTNKWVVIGELPSASHRFGIAYDGIAFDLIGETDAFSANAVVQETKYGWLDHVVVAIFMFGMLFIGSYLAKREKDSATYFRGGKRIPWWASGLSLFATGASAISLMAMPGKAYAGNWFFMTVSFYCVMTWLPLSIFVFMPIARRLKVATANEYLELRFNIYLRIGGSIIWALLQMLGRMAALMLLPAIAISSITGFPMEWSIILMGVVTTFYVFFGGLEGVIWTDVFQAVVMIAAVVLCGVWAIFGLEMDVAQAWANIESAQKMHMFDWEISWVEPCALVMFLNIFITGLGQIGDQNYIQRVQCTATEKEAKKAVYMQMAVAVPLNGVLFLLGTVLYLYYMENPQLVSPAVKADGIFPLFAAQKLPMGLAGLVIAAILAATMSTLSSAINAVANLGVEDFYRRFKKDVTDHSCVVVGRWLTIGLGIFGTVFALILANTDLKSIWDLYMVILGMLVGPLSGVYILGIFTKRSTSIGVLLGALASLYTGYYVKEYTHLHFLSYPIFGMLACYGVGYFASIILPSKPKNIDGLTIYTLSPSEEV